MEILSFFFKADYDELINPDSMRRIGKRRLESFIRQREDKKLWIFAENILRSAKSSGITVVVRENRLFPERFRDIKDMPTVLYTKGKIAINEFSETIGIVGARRCSPEGKRMAIDTATEAVENNNAVISGMAKGIDSYAHTAAVKAM